MKLRGALCRIDDASMSNLILIITALCSLDTLLIYQH